MALIYASSILKPRVSALGLDFGAYLAHLGLR